MNGDVPISRLLAEWRGRLRRPAWLPRNTLRWALVPLAAALALVGYDWFRLSSLASLRYTGQGWRFPTRVYADTRDWRVGDAMEPGAIRSALDRIRYRRVWRRPTGPGEYRMRGSIVEIQLRPFTFPDRIEPGSKVVVESRGGRIVSIGEGFTNPTPRGFLRLDPELLAEFSDPARERRSYVSLATVPRHVVLAVVASEDRRFFRHFGLDLLGIGRATVRNAKARALVEGGSTLTQQLVKNLFLSRERSVVRKAHEALLALLAELRYSKDEILEFYLNQIYLGQRGSWSVCGVEEGALFYFNKHARELTVGEAALLAGIIPAPNRMSPYRDPELALARRGQVLDDMVDCGWLSKSEADAIRAKPLRFAPSPAPATRAPYFVDYVREVLARDIREADLVGRGYAVFTTLDASLQSTAERAVRDGARAADWNSPTGGAERYPAQAGLVAIEPSTGYVRAMVGGRSYAESAFNRAVDSRRQPGSAFKPFILVAALDSPFRGRRPPLTAATILEDAPDTFRTNLGLWAPKNFGAVYEGRVTAARALARSLNVATIHLAQEVGLKEVVRSARALGLESRLREVASLALGTSEVSLIELTSAYAALANGGVHVKPIPVKGVLDRAGSVRWTPRRDAHRAVRPETAYLANVLLQGPIIHGTAAAVRTEYGFTRPAAGKTGTTDDEHDAWFVGYTPDLAAGVWVGCDRQRRLGLTGSQAAVPIWTRLMEAAHRSLPLRDFEAPPGVRDVWIDGDTGYRAGPDCTHVMRAAFVAGTEPRAYCPVYHPPAWLDSLGTGSIYFNERGEPIDMPAEAAPGTLEAPADQGAEAGPDSSLDQGKAEAESQAR